MPAAASSQTWWWSGGRGVKPVWKGVTGWLWTVTSLACVARVLTLLTLTRLCWCAVPATAGYMDTRRRHMTWDC